MEIRTPPKKFYMIFVLSLTGLALFIFLIFGYLLKEYITYSIDKQKAHKEIESLWEQHEEIKNYLHIQEDAYEKRLKEITSITQQQEAKIAVRQAQIDSQKEALDKINVLSQRIEIKRNELSHLQEDIQEAHKTLEESKGNHIALVAKNSDLKDMYDTILKETEQKRIILSDKINLLKQVAEDKENDILKLSSQKTNLETENATLNGKLLVLKQEIEEKTIQHNDKSLELSNLSSIVDSLSEKRDQETIELSRLDSVQDELKQQISIGETQVAELKAELSTSLKRINEEKRLLESITSQISQMSEKKASLLGDINGLQERVSSAKMILSQIKSEIKQQEERLKEIKEYQSETSEGNESNND